CGSPTGNFFRLFNTASSNCSFSLRGTSTRVPAEHTCPVFIAILESAAFAALFISASSNTTTGDLPPSSSATFLIVFAAFSITVCPTPSEPVKERSEEHTSELQSRFDIVCRLLLEKKNVYKLIII